jgi:hypothetical protein
MINPIVDMPPKNPWTMRRKRRTGRLEINPINSMITAWESNPPKKRVLALRWKVKDPQKVDASAATKAGAPKINPTHISVS